MYTRVTKTVIALLCLTLFLCPIKHVSADHTTKAFVQKHTLATATPTTAKEKDTLFNKFKDMLKKGAGTEFIIDEIEIDKQIPAVKFTKASLK